MSFYFLYCPMFYIFNFTIMKKFVQSKIGKIVTTAIFLAAAYLLGKEIDFLDLINLF